MFLNRDIGGSTLMIPGFLASVKEIFSVSSQEKKALTCCSTEEKMC